MVSNKEKIKLENSIWIYTITLINWHLPSFVYVWPLRFLAISLYTYRNMAGTTDWAIYLKKNIIGLEFHTIGNPALIICPQWYAIQRRLMCFCFFFWCVLWKNPWLEPKQATIFLFYFLNIGHCCSVFLHINWQHPSPELPLAYIDKATHMV